MLWLRTFGGIRVADEQGEPLGGAASQRRLLALLTALAVAGDRGLHREKLFTLLWPDSEEERARHSLTQALYAARRALGVDDLFLLAGDVRLNPERIRSDVQELDEALNTDDLERAAELYRGPFADGFFLPGSAEFEQWVSLERARFEDRIAGVLDRLARRAEAAGQAREAVEWRRRLAALRPLDASAAVALMTTLAQSGDRAAALRHAQLHETMLREQLGIEPDPVVTSLAARLRQPVEWRVEGLPVALDEAAPGPHAAAVQGPAAAGVGLVESVDATDPTAPAPTLERLPVLQASTPELVAPPAAKPSTAWRAVPAKWLALVGLAVAVVAGVVVRLRAPEPAPAAPAAPRLEQHVVVAPFRVTGASASLAYLRDGLVELLSTRLADDSSARSVDAGAVLAAWRAAGLTDSADVARETVVQLARGLGAQRVVIGSVVGTTSRVVITASVVSIASGQLLGEATVEGPADSVTSIVDRLAAHLLLLDAGEDAALSELTTKSLRALRAYLDGQAAFRAGNYLIALRAYERALLLDPAFALAALQSARAADRLQALEVRAGAIAAAWREREALDARARALLVALAGPRYPAVSRHDEQLAAWERVLDLTPDRADSWYEFAARLYQEGAVAGVADAQRRAVSALESALRVDPAHVPSRELLAQIGVAEPGAAAPAAGTAAQRADSELPLSPYLRWHAALRRHDAATLQRLRDALPQLGPRNLRTIAIAAQRAGAGLEDARQAVRQLRARATRAADRVQAALAAHALARNEGRLRAADEATDQLAELQPSAHAHLRLRVLDALYGDGDTLAANAAATALRRAVVANGAAEPNARAVQLADACVLAQWRLHGNDTTGVHGILQRLRAEPVNDRAVSLPVATAPLACAELVDAALAVATGRAGARDAVARLDSLAFTSGVAGDASTYAPILIARLHERLGDVTAALNAVRRRDELVGWPRYLATAMREEGRYAALAGATADARVAYRKFLALRDAPDPELRSQVEDVRRALAALPES